MKYGSVCSGIEAATVAWDSLGWEPVFFSEIEPFPCAVLAHHYPTVPNLGDMNKFKEWPDATIDVLVGGTPCQSFSVAGLRKGLDDPRGNLMLTYLAIANKYRPKWLVWENVPGVLSSNGGRDFAALLRGMAECGYGFAYRILDAQYFGVAQRRRRVFVVGCFGSWQSAAAVLFERHSLQGNTPPRREKREKTSCDAGISTEGCFGIDEECNVGDNQFGPLLRGGQGGTRQATAYSMITANTNANGLGVTCELSATLDRAQGQAVACAEISPTVTNGPPFSRTGNERVECEALVWPAEVAPTLDAHYGDKQGLDNQHINGGGALFVPYHRTGKR